MKVLMQQKKTWYASMSIWNCQRFKILTVLDVYYDKINRIQYFFNRKLSPYFLKIISKKLIFSEHGVLVYYIISSLHNMRLYPLS